jgi:hypothetical protein
LGGNILDYLRDIETAVINKQFTVNLPATSGIVSGTGGTPTGTSGGTNGNVLVNPLDPTSVPIGPTQTGTTINAGTGARNFSVYAPEIGSKSYSVETSLSDTLATSILRFGALAKNYATFAESFEAKDPDADSGLFGETNRRRAQGARLVQSGHLDDLYRYGKSNGLTAADLIPFVNVIEGKIVDAATVSEIFSTRGTLGRYAKGGYAQGLALVGEEGPELVDFKTPGRVYTARDTNEFFNRQAANTSNTEMINELKALRQEIKELREQQKTETGHVIQATYDAQAQNADAIAGVVNESSSKALWANRSARSVGLR